MIRVLSVIRHPVGGIRTYLKYTYAALPKDKYAFTALIVRSLESRQLAQDLAERGIRCVEVSDTRPNLSLLRAIWDGLKAEPDLIHSHGFTSGVLAAAANLTGSVPHVVTSHDVFRPDQFSGIAGRIKAQAIGALLGRADIVHSVSADAQDNLQAYLPGLSAAQLVVIRNGIDVERFGDAGQARPAGPVAGRGPFVFGFFGRLMPQKGFGDLVDAVALLKNDPVVGEGFVIRVISDGGYIREHRADIASRGLSDYFDFRGFLPDISTAIASVDAVVIPSLWEACPLVPMEVLVAGCPVIASTCIGLREVIKDTPAVAIEPRAPRELAEAMRQMMRSPAASRAAATRFMAAARRRFDVRDASTGLDAIFERARVRDRNRTRLRLLTAR